MKGIIIIFSFFAFHTAFSQTVTLRDTTNQFDYIIITVPEFVNACEEFKQHKETIRGFNTLIVDTTQIFAEFDSSDTPQDNIRDFISYAGTFWKNPQPKYFFIAGSVQFVPNFNIPNPSGYNSPYWQSDYYYSQNIYEGDTTTIDFCIGRLPGKNSVQLENYFSKVIDYESNQILHEWMNNILFISEDEPPFGFFEAALALADTLPSYIRSYLISSADTSEYYGNKDSIYNVINNIGCSVVWFEGHSSDSSFVSHDYFDLDDLAGLNNESKYFLTIFPFTQRAIIDTNTNLTNEMLILMNSGSIGGFVNSGLVYWGIIKIVQELWAIRLYNPEFESLWEIFNIQLPFFGMYYYVRKVINLWADPSIKLKYDITVDVEDFQAEVPTDFTLHQNYPNPFNPSTKIKFTVPQFPILGGDGRGGLVTLKVYDVLGKEIATLVNEEKLAGNYEVEFNATNVPSGVYFYQLRAGLFIQTKKMILVK